MSKSTPPLRLPKLVEADPRSSILLEGIKKLKRSPWSKNSIVIPKARLDDHLATSLKDAFVKGHIVRGLEGAERTLNAEQRGLQMADEKSGQVRGTRISRLLLLANDGSERFYRQVDTLLVRNPSRVMALELDVNALGLGEVLFGPNKVARLVMLEHKLAVASVLLAVADQWSKK